MPITKIKRFLPKAWVNLHRRWRLAKSIYQIRNFSGALPEHSGSHSSYLPQVEDNLLTRSRDGLELETTKNPEDSSKKVPSARRILKKLTQPLREGKKRISGRNNQGRITVRRRGGGHKRNARIIAFNKQRLETAYMVYDLVYDPNRTAQLALVGPVIDGPRLTENRFENFNLKDLLVESGEGTSPRLAIMACHRQSLNELARPTHSLMVDQTKSISSESRLLTSKDFIYILAPKGVIPGDILRNWKVDPETSSWNGRPSVGRQALDLDLDSDQIRPSLGDSLPLWKIALGSLIHNIEINPGQGGRYVRAGGGYGQVLDKSVSKSKVLIRLPSGEKKWFPFTAYASMGVVASKQALSAVLKALPMGPRDLPHSKSLRAQGRSEGPTSTFGRVKISETYNSSEDSPVSLQTESIFLQPKGGGANSVGTKRILGKAGRNRWLGRRPKVRGVAMNPVDHPHGGGEGRTSGGRPSVTPWGRPTKGGKTRSPSKNKRNPLLKLGRATLPYKGRVTPPQPRS